MVNQKEKIKMRKLKKLKVKTVTEYAAVQEGEKHVKVAWIEEKLTTML